MGPLRLCSQVCEVHVETMDGGMVWQAEDAEE